jgi:acetoin utilization protein AcuB
MQKNTSDIMSKKLITVTGNTPLLEAYKIMNERNIRHLPVTNTEGGIIGILSDRDLQRAMQVGHRNSGIDEGTVEFKLGDQVQDFMSFPVKTVGMNNSVRDVASAMLKEKVSAYLVTDQFSQTRGIVTTDDMLKLLISLLDKDPSKLRLAIDHVIEDFAPHGQWANA